MQFCFIKRWNPTSTFLPKYLVHPSCCCHAPGPCPRSSRMSMDPPQLGNCPKVGHTLCWSEQTGCTALVLCRQNKVAVKTIYFSSSHTLTHDIPSENCTNPQRFLFHLFFSQKKMSSRIYRCIAFLNKCS